MKAIVSVVKFSNFLFNFISSFTSSVQVSRVEADSTDSDASFLPLTASF